MKRVASSFGTMTCRPQSGLGVVQPSHCDEFQNLCEGGQLDKALNVLLRLDQQGTLSSVNMFQSLLKACTKRKALPQAKRVHSHLVKHKLELSSFFGETMVSALVKCGSLKDALQVFHGLTHRTVFSWTAIISGYTMVGQGQKALTMYEEMQAECVKPNAYTFVSLLKACGSIADTDEGRRLHAEAIKHRFEADLFVCNCLLDMYGKCGSIVDAQNVFYGMSKRDVVSWTAMLAAYGQLGQPEKALQLYEQMREEGVSPNDRTFVSVLQACGMLAEKKKKGAVRGQCTTVKYLQRGKAIHADAWKRGYDSDVFVGNTLISMYGKCCSTVDAQNVFDGLSQRDVVSWNVMLQAYVQQGHVKKALQLYEQMQQCCSANEWSFVTALQACSILAEKETHAMFDGQSAPAKALEIGRSIHADAWSKGFDSHVFVTNTLITMYGKCGSVEDAQIVFDVLSKQDVVSWNIILAAYVEHCQEQKALQLYQRMQEEGISPDGRTLMSVLQACAMLADKEEGASVYSRSSKMELLATGRNLHAHTWRKGYTSDVFVGNTLVNMYGKFGSVADAWNVFDGLSEPNVVSWNVILVAHVEQAKLDRALQLYIQMCTEGVSPDERTLVTVLQACSMLAEREEQYVVDGQPTKAKHLENGKAIHAKAQVKGYITDVFVVNTLLTMYKKCGSIVDAQNVFNRMSERSVVSWSAMLAAYVEHGEAEKALQLYKQMQEEGVSPVARSFVSALQACGILGEMSDGRVYGQYNKGQSLEIGVKIHADVKRYGLDSDAFVGSALVNMYGKCGSMVDARTVFDELPKQNVVLWNAMLTIYIQNGVAERALELYTKMLEEAVSPDAWTSVSALQACTMLADNEVHGMQDVGSIKLEAFQKGRALHAEAWRKGCDADVFVGRALVSMYGKCRSIMDVQNVFDGLVQPDVSAWSAMLAAYVEQRHVDKVLQLYEQMQEEGVSPNSRTIVTLLQAFGITAGKEECTVVNGRDTTVICLEQVRAVHADAARRGWVSDVFVVSTLVSAYGKCRSIADAQNVFDGIFERNVVSWNAMLAAYVEQGQAEKTLLLYAGMREEGVSPDPWTILSAIQACGMLAEAEEDIHVNGQATKAESLGKAKAIHADALMKGYNLNVFVASALITIYGKCRRLVDASNVFDEVVHRDVAIWTAMLGAYVELGNGKRALELYQQMNREGISPDIRTFVSALHACGMAAENEIDVVVDGRSTKLESLEMGRAIHAAAQEKGYESDLFVGNTLVSMYGKCGSIMDAQHVFDELSGRNVVSWNAMLAAYVQQGDFEKVLELCRAMQGEGVTADEITLVCILQACSNTGSLAIVRQIHHTIISKGEVLSPFLASALVTTYGRCARMGDAQNVFDGLPHPDLVSWNALIAGYARQGDSFASLLYYGEMLLAGVKPDGITFLSILSACSHSGLVDEGAGFFESMKRDHGITPEIDHYVSMVDLLGRAGYFNRLEHFLSSMPMQPNLALWLSVLSACRKHGKLVLGKAAFDCAVRLQPKHPAAYVLMSNILADGGFWERAKELKRVRQKGGAQKMPGQSWIEHEQEMHTFLVGYRMDPQHRELYDLVSYGSSRHQKGILSVNTEETM